MRLPARTSSTQRDRLCAEQVEAREHAEHLLQKTEATIRDLKTNLAHERLARDEAIQRADSEKQVVEQAFQRVQDELAIEPDWRQKAKQKRDDAFAARQGAAAGGAGGPGCPEAAVDAHTWPTDAQEAEEADANNRGVCRRL